MESVIFSIEGYWSGSYGYSGGRLPVEFEASFTFNGHPTDFTGWIRDNGPLGDAQVRGQQLGRTIKFTKYYIAPFTDAATKSIDYTGELSEDGGCLKGRWKLDFLTSGPWEIYRPGADRNATASNAWPPSVAKSAIPELNVPTNLKPMTAYQQGDILTLNKPQSPQAVGMTKGVIGAVLAPMLTFAAIAAFITMLQPGRRSPQHFVVMLLVYVVIGSFSIVPFAVRWFKILRFGDIYTLDRNNGSITRNTKSVGWLQEISYVELRSPGGSNTTSTITLVMQNGRRMFVETGDPANVAAIAQTIAQFVGVQVASIA